MPLAKVIYKLKTGVRQYQAIFVRHKVNILGLQDVNHMVTYYVRRVLAHTISRLIYHLPQEIDICTQAVCCQNVYINSGHVTWFNLERSAVKLKEINL